MQDELSRLRDEVWEIGYAVRNAGFSNLATESLAAAIGDPVALGGGQIVHEISPKTMEEALSNTYSGNYGLGEFPLHTDMSTWFVPPRYLMLRCIVGMSDVATTVVDPISAIDAIGAANLIRAVMKPRKRVAGKIGLLSIARRIPSGLMIRWDDRYLVPCSRSGETYARAFASEIKTLVVEKVSLSEPGDLLILDNWRMLHGRSSVSESGRSRRIERVYLKAIGHE